MPTSCANIRQAIIPAMTPSRRPAWKSNNIPAPAQGCPLAGGDKKADSTDDVIGGVTSGEYKYGFTSDIETDIIPRGISEEVIRLISHKKGEPEWLLEFRLKAYRHWLTMEMPRWAHLDIPDIDYQAISYYAAPRTKEAPKSLDEVDPQVIDTFNRLGIPLEEQKSPPARGQPCAGAGILLDSIYCWLLTN